MRKRRLGAACDVQSLTYDGLGHTIKTRLLVCYRTLAKVLAKSAFTAGWIHLAIFVGVCLVTISMELVTNRLAVLGARKIGFLTKKEDFADARIELDESKSLACSGRAVTRRRLCFCIPRGNMRSFGFAQESSNSLIGRPNLRH